MGKRTQVVFKSKSQGRFRIYILHSESLKGCQHFSHTNAASFLAGKRSFKCGITDTIDRCRNWVSGMGFESHSPASISDLDTLLPGQHHTRTNCHKIDQPGLETCHSLWPIPQRTQHTGWERTLRTASQFHRRQMWKCSITTAQIYLLKKPKFLLPFPNWGRGSLFDRSRVLCKNRKCT